ncbi:MAG: PAS domain-containing protein [Gammaproteobacteria bacterium]
MGEALIATDPAGRMLTVNPAALQLLGYAEAELIGQPFECLFTDEDPPKGRPGLRSTEVHETTWRTKHDQRIPVLLTSADLRDRRNTVEASVGRVPAPCIGGVIPTCLTTVAPMYRVAPISSPSTASVVSLK